ncbi:hypothetical protein BBOV_II001510 [Babesia bovis T2Bo]|uniref:Uncharacterized protein n=1 Tax=Babesia bovis TaxID=5865 RepID=A7AT47_BABBO|nr:hypothetical protein BBOV_II001510 [Babesia bovis T2Bo]EDO06108.1 hypothetical protein BBOV_II001510 [Babesia bovis T2Bo]|eukprot:XP_001609676.1 hypothetical protein [Babesia bovis T2Bo]
MYFGDIDQSSKSQKDTSQDPLQPSETIENSTNKSTVSICTPTDEEYCNIGELSSTGAHQSCNLKSTVDDDDSNLLDSRQSVYLCVDITPVDDTTDTNITLDTKQDIAQRITGDSIQTYNERSPENELDIKGIENTQLLGAQGELRKDFLLHISNTNKQSVPEEPNTTSPKLGEDSSELESWRSSEASTRAVYNAETYNTKSGRYTSLGTYRQVAKNGYNKKTFGQLSDSEASPEYISEDYSNYDFKEESEASDSYRGQVESFESDDENEAIDEIDEGYYTGTNDSEDWNANKETKIKYYSQSSNSQEGYSNSDNTDQCSEQSDSIDDNREQQNYSISDNQEEILQPEEVHSIIHKRRKRYLKAPNLRYKRPRRSYDKSASTLDYRKDVSIREERESKAFPANTFDDSSTAVWCRILQNELSVLRAQKNTWVDREHELLQRIERARDEIKRQNAQLIDAETKVVQLEQNIQLITWRAKIRHETLETSYKTLCENVKLAEEASLKTALEIKKLQTRNMVLEELIQIQAMEQTELNTRLDHINNSDADTIPLTTGNDVHYFEDVSATPMGNIKEGTNDNETTSVSHDNTPFTKTEPTEINTNALQEIVQVLKSQLEQMVISSKHMEKYVKETMEIYIYELKDLLQQTKSDLAYKTEECNAVKRSLETMKLELEMVKRNLTQSLEMQTELSEKSREKELQNDAQKREIETLHAQVKELKDDLSSSMLREGANRTALDEYMREIRAKMYQMESLCKINRIQMESQKADASTGVEQDHQHDNKEVDETTDSPCTMGSSADVNSAIETKTIDSKQSNPLEDTSCASASNGKCTIETNDTQTIDLAKMKSVFKETVVNLQKKVELLTEKLKEQVVRAYNYEQQINQMKPQIGTKKCECHRALEKSNATKMKRCWCKYKRIGELKRRISRASLKLDAMTIAAVVKGEALTTKRRKLEKAG